MADYKLDRTAFKMYHAKDVSNNYNYWKSQSIKERLQAANYLNSVAFNFPVNALQNLAELFLKCGK